MATITVRDLPDDVYERLKTRAAEHRRCLNSEVIWCLECQCGRPQVDLDFWLPRVKALRERVNLRIESGHRNALAMYVHTGRRRVADAEEAQGLALHGVRL